MARNVSKSKVVIEFDLNGEDQEVLESAAGKKGLAPFLKAYAEAYFHEVAQGGLLLTSADMISLKKASGKDIQSSEEILELVEKGKKLSKGNHTFEITLDPALVDSFRQNADFMGITVDEFLQDCWSHIHANGWLYQVMPDVNWVPLNSSDVKAIKEATNTEIVTSSDIVEMVRKAASN